MNRILSASRVLGAALALCAPCFVRAAERVPPFPADTQVVAFVNVRQLVEAPLVKKHALQPVQAALQRSADAQQFFRAANLDLLRDVDNLVISSAGPADASHVLVVAHGRFDPEKLQAAAEAFAKNHSELLAIRKQDTVTVYEARTPDHPAPVFAVVLNRGTLLLSPSRDYLLQGMKVQAGRSDVPNDALLALLKQTDDRQSLWVVARVTDDLRKLLATTPQTADVAPKLKAFTVNAVVNESAEVNMRIVTTDAQTAVSAQRFLEGAKAILSLAALNDDQYGRLLATLIDAFEIGSDKNTVTVTAKITESLIEKGLKKEP